MNVGNIKAVADLMGITPDVVYRISQTPTFIILSTEKGFRMTRNMSEGWFKDDCRVLEALLFEDLGCDFISYKEDEWLTTKKDLKK